MKASDERSFTVVVDARAPVLRRTAYSLCGDWHLADDLVQKTLLKLFTAWPLRENGAVDAWLTRALVRTYIDETRRGWWRRERVSEALPDSAAPAAESSTDGRLLAHLDALPPRQRACIILRFLEDYSVEQVAQTLSCSVGTVRSHTSRGLAVIRAGLAESETSTSGKGSS